MDRPGRSSSFSDLVRRPVCRDPALGLAFKHYPRFEELWERFELKISAPSNQRSRTVGKCFCILARAHRPVLEAGSCI